MTTRDTDHDDRTTEELLVEMADPRTPPDRRERLVEDLVRMHRPLASDIARRYRFRGEPMDDLLQAAYLGLMKAIAGFDAGLGHDFRGYAAITMAGEVKRHFRDRTWAIKVPGRYQQRRPQLNRSIAELTQAHGRAPTVAELAAEMDLSEEEILLTLDAVAAYRTLSLDAPMGDTGGSWAEVLAHDDRSLAALLDKHALKPHVDALPAREKNILLLRFYGNLSQAEIATELGISQMHVSRILRSVLTGLRTALSR